MMFVGRTSANQSLRDIAELFANRLVLPQPPVKFLIFNFVMTVLHEDVKSKQKIHIIDGNKSLLWSRRYKELRQRSTSSGTALMQY